MFAAILRRTSEKTLPVSSGEAISRFGHDVAEVSDFPLWLPHMAGVYLSSLTAIIIMARINLTITLVIFVPLAGTMLISRLAWSRYLQYGHASRAAAGAVTGFLGEIFGAVQAAKVAHAEADVVAHFHTSTRPGAKRRCGCACSNGCSIRSMAARRALVSAWCYYSPGER